MDLDGLEGGSRFARAKRFALNGSRIEKWTAKDDVGNVGAGRAAKGASPASSSKIKQPILSVVLFFLFIAFLDELEGRSRFARAKRFALRSLDKDKCVGKGRR